MPARRRAAGLAVALVLETLLLLALLTLGVRSISPPDEEKRIVAFDLASDSPESVTPKPSPEPKTQTARKVQDTKSSDTVRQRRLEDAPDPAPKPEPTLPSLVELSRSDLAAAD